MEPQPYTGQSSGETYKSNLTYSLSSIINAGLGFEHVLSSDVELYGSFITNFSANDDTGNLWTLKENLNQEYMVLYFYPAALTGG